MSKPTAATAAVCPRCGGTYDTRFPALSRWDNATYICGGDPSADNDCGQQEAMLDYRAGEYRAGGTHLDPLLGVHPWVDPGAASRPSAEGD